MKKLFLFLFLLLLVTGFIAAEDRNLTLGAHVLGGGRYDNLRMCVGSPAGVPGGPIGELYFDVGIPVGDSGRVVINIPLFRPIVFAAAFQMLQLEPLVMYEHVLGSGPGTRPVVGGGVGMIFHYGPDYFSSPEARGESFFSTGPSINGFAGLILGKSNFTAGIKGFFAPLFTPGGENGIVAGGGLEIHYTFLN